jgi:hypothetical protein
LRVKFPVSRPADPIQVTPGVVVLDLADNAMRLLKFPLIFVVEDA